MLISIKFQTETKIFLYQGETGVSELSSLQQSMLLLAESLDSGAISGQFEQLYRRNPSIAITECHLPQNAPKNRLVIFLV